MSGGWFAVKTSSQGDTIWWSKNYGGGDLGLVMLGPRDFYYWYTYLADSEGKRLWLDRGGAPSLEDAKRASDEFFRLEVIEND